MYGVQQASLTILSVCIYHKPGSHRVAHSRRRQPLHSQASTTEPSRLFNCVLTFLPHSVISYVLVRSQGEYGLLSALPVCDKLVKNLKSKVLRQFPLNDDQIKVLDTCGSWLTHSDSQREAEENPKQNISVEKSPIVLVHGAFGSGKSYMLVVLIIFFCRVLDQIDPLNKVK